MVNPASPLTVVPDKGLQARGVLVSDLAMGGSEQPRRV